MRDIIAVERLACFVADHANRKVSVCYVFPTTIVHPDLNRYVQAAKHFQSLWCDQCVDERAVHYNREVLGLLLLVINVCRFRIPLPYPRLVRAVRCEVVDEIARGISLVNETGIPVSIVLLHVNRNVHRKRNCLVIVIAHVEQEKRGIRRIGSNGDL